MEYSGDTKTREALRDDIVTYIGTVQRGGGPRGYGDRYLYSRGRGHIDNDLSDEDDNSSEEDESPPTLSSAMHVITNCMAIGQCDAKFSCTH